MTVLWTWALPILRALLGCKRCMIVLAIGVALIVANQLGQHKARTECQEAQLHARIAKQRADLENAKKAEADAKARATEIEDQASDQRKEDADYIARLKDRPNASCDLTDDDIRGLPNHRHRNGARPAGPAR
jgi:uncharacterized protein YlxW (UPF0749 family)